MILTDSAILNQIEQGNIIIAPFQAGCLGSNSYDVHLSKNLAVYKDVCLVDENNHFSKIKSWENITRSIFPPNYHYLDSRSQNPTHPLEIPEDGLILQPGILYLGATIEYTKTKNLVPYLEGKSSIGRLGIKVHVTAGKGDIGFEGHWTLEIEVTHPVKVYPGMKIAQLTYFRPEGFTLTPYNKKRSAKYNNEQGDEFPAASRNELNFKTLEDRREQQADSGVAGIEDEEARFQQYEREEEHGISKD